MDTDILKRLIRKEIDAIIDRSIGTTHPKYKEMIYSVNYGYLSVKEIEEANNYQEKCFKYEIIIINNLQNNLKNEWMKNDKLPLLPL